MVSGESSITIMLLNFLLNIRIAWLWKCDS